MPNITITASANSTPPANTVVATCQLAGGQHVQQMMMTDGANVAVVDSASRILTAASIVNSPSVVVASGSLVVTNALSASISGGSVALLAGVNAIGSISVTNLAGSAAGSPLFVSVTNSPSVIVASGSMVVTNQVSASISNSPSVIVSSGSVIVTNQVSASISNSPSVVVSSGSLVVTNALSASISNTLTASAIQSTPTGIGNAWPVKITDGTDTVSVTAASLLQVAISAASVNIVDTAGNQYGISAASPLYITGGAAGGTSSNDRTIFAEGTTALTPAGGFYFETAASLTACQVGAQRMTAYRAVHANLRDASGNQLGITGSPLVVSTSTGGGTNIADRSVYAEGTTAFTPVGGFFSTNPIALTACQSGAARLTANRAVHSNFRDSNGNELGSGTGSPLFASVTNSPSVIVSSGSVVVTNSVSASISNSPSVIVSSGSVVVTNSVSASISNSPSVIVSSGSVVVINPISASISNTVTITGSGIDADKATFAEGTTTLNVVGGMFLDTTVSLTASQVGIARQTAQRAIHVNLRDNNGSQLGAGTASPLYSSITNLAGSAAGSPLFVSVTNSPSVIVSSGSVVVTNALSASISNSPSVIVSSGSVVVTNALSASISGGSVALLTGANAIGTVAVTNLAGSAAGSPLFTSVTNIVSASIGSGSVALLAGANVIGSASVIQSTPTGVANAWPVTLAQSGSVYGVSGSPLAVAQDVKNLWFAGSLIAASTVNLSASVSGCTRIVASAAGKAILVLAATYVTSNSQNIGWVASGAGAASVLVQSPMPFAQFGGMDANRHPGTLWEFPSGSNAILTTTSACIVAGNITYIQVAS